MQHTCSKVCVGKFKERIISGGLGIGGTVIFIWISENKTIEFAVIKHVYLNPF